MIKYVLAIFLVIASHAQAAETPVLVIDSEKSFKIVRSLKIPNLGEVLSELEYFEAAVPLVFISDLNGDDEGEILIRSNESLCGNGGCEYILINGKSKNRIGDFFGNPLVIMQKKKGQRFPDIQAYAHSGGGTGDLQTFRYYNGKYKSVSTVALSGKQIDKYFERISKTPIAGRQENGKLPTGR